MNNNTMKITILGSGTSTGVPQLGCTCRVCRSTDRRDKRMRQSALVEYQGKKILIDCGPDFRRQMLEAGCSKIDALLITHIHYDHIGGLEELRGEQFNIPIFARGDVIDGLKSRLAYCFGEQPYPGAPHLETHEVNDFDEFECCGIKVQPIPVMHVDAHFIDDDKEYDIKLPILGFKIGPLSYITDCKTIAPQQVERLKGIPLLIINALRTEEHMSHLSLSQALEIIERINPGRAILVHMSHDMGLHREVSQLLPPQVELAYDGMTLEV